MTATRLVIGKVMSLAATVLMCAEVHAQSVERSKEDGVFHITLADANLSLQTLSEAEGALAAHGATRAKVEAVGGILRRVRESAGEPTRRPVPWAFTENLAAGPYLQSLTGNSVLIRWAAIQSDTVVRYGLGGRLTSEASASRLPSPRWMHEALLTGLKSGAEYTYCIRIGEVDVQGTFLASPAGDSPFTFAVWADSQCFPKVFSGVVRQMTRHEWKHHFVLVEVGSAGLKARAIGDKGQVIDEFEIRRPARGGPLSRPPRVGGRTRSPARIPAKPDLPTDDARWCRISAADRAAALAALEECCEALGENGTGIASRLALVGGVLKDARSLARESTWKGPVERTVHRVPRLVAQGIHWRLKPSAGADASVRAILDEIGHGEDRRLIGRTFEAKGLDAPLLPLRWILVDSITPK